MLRLSFFRTFVRLAFLFALAGIVALTAQESRKIRDTGPTASRVNVVLLGDGYTTVETEKFFADAQRILTVLVNDPAFATFKDVINGFAIFAASNESGTDIPSQGVTRDTYFNTSFGISGVDRALAINNGTGMGRLNLLLGQLVPEYDIVILLVNSPKYGGSGGFPATVSLDPSADEVMLHEIGHSFAGLADEYVDEAVMNSYPVRESINATQRTDRAAIPWTNFILDTTPVPTPGFSSDPNYVGSFEGAYYRPTGFFRPTSDSKMRSLGRPWGPVNVRAFATALQRLNLNSATATPTLSIQPFSQAVPAGSNVTLAISASGVGPFTYQWSFQGKYIAGATSPTLFVGALTAANAGAYRVEVANGRGTLISNTATLSIGTSTPSDARLYAISCRAVVGTGGDVLIPGIIVGGSGDRQVVVRAKGPSITGVPLVLAQPRLTLHEVGVATPIAVNNGWDSGTLAETNALRTAFTQAGLGQFPDGSADCAVLATLRAGHGYTAVISGAGPNPTGIALVEVFEVGTGTARLSAISCRARVGTGDDVLIPGIIILGTTPKQVLLRASAPIGVSDTLAQPRLTLFDSSGAQIATNAGWGSSPTAAQAIFSATVACGLANFPENSANSAILATLPPGGYTAHVSGVGNTTGVALIEVYEVP
ncbi:MAG TPA: M64 family metallopeptidase [Opitutaceae bacterium]|nr:M64 family metallopeptidase [Opitutaceae bacterium]